jgi:hypothetical protein
VAAETIKAMGTALKGMLSTKEVQDYVKSLEAGPLKGILSHATANAKGLTTDDMKGLSKALPSVIQEAYKRQFVTEVKNDDGSTSYVVPEMAKDEGSYSRTAYQQNLAQYTGLRTSAENDFLEGKSYYKYLDANSKGKLTALKEGIVQALGDNPERVQSNVDEIAAEFGPEVIDTMLEDLKHLQEHKSLNFFDLQALKGINKTNPVALEKLKQQLEAARSVARESPNRLLTGPMSESERASDDRALQYAGGGRADSSDTTNVDFKKYPITSAAVPSLRARDI